MSSKNNVCIYFAATEKRRIKVTRISDVLSVWGTRIKRLDEYNLRTFPPKTFPRTDFFLNLPLTKVMIYFCQKGKKKMGGHRARF